MFSDFLYDEISQIDDIKERAREIAELPDEEFDKYVSHVRDLSLAPASELSKCKKVSSTHTSTNSNSQSVVKSNNMTSNTESSKNKFTKQLEAIAGGDLKYIDDVEDDLVPKATLTSLNRTSRHFAPSSGDSQEGSISGCEQDSGVFNSSRATISSPSDGDVGSDDERPGVFDYFHYANKKGAVMSSDSEIFRSHNKAYDEAYDAESDESPRSNSSTVIDSENNDGTEMQTFRILDGTCGFPYVRLEEDDDDSLQDIVVHERLYGHQNNETPFDVLHEDEEEYEFYDCQSSTNKDPGRSEISFSNSKTSTNFSVDAAVNFPFISKGYGACNDQKSTDNNSPSVSIHVSKMEKISKAEFKKDDDKVDTSATPLLHKTGRTYSFSKDKCLTKGPTKEDDASKETAGSDDKKETTSPKKKKKKKKQDKDDTGSDSSGPKEKASYDLNGNPLAQWETVSHNNRYSRQSGSPRSVQSSTRGNSSSSSSINQRYLQRYQYSTFPFSQFSEYELNGVPLSELDDMPPSDPSSATKKKRKKVKKDDNIVRSENIPGYRGNDKIEDVLSFIENTGNSKKKKRSTDPSVFTNQSDHKTTKKSNKERKNNKSSSIDMTKDEKSISDTASENSVDMKGVNEDSATQVILENENMPIKEQISVTVADGEVYHDTVNHIEEVDTNEEVPQVKYDDTNDKITGDQFIFTDFDPSVRFEEGEFKPVGKKKKVYNKSPVTSYSRDFGIPNAYPIISHSQQPKDTAVRDIIEPRPRRPYHVRSVTPPPHSANKIEKTDRDLSPSAFPALGREGRRNSTGDVPSTVAEILPQDDSDLESVKSLPVQTTDTSLDGRHTWTMSYAKMAASPKPSPSASTILATSNTSPHSERRHSFEDSSVGSKIQTEHQIYKSQELLPSKTELCEAKDIPETSHQKPTSVPDSQHSLSESANDNQQQPPKAPSSNAKKSKSNTRNNNKSSVVFLDNKVNVMPSDLGISFGFDSDDPMSNESPSNDQVLKLSAEEQYNDKSTPLSFLSMNGINQDFVDMHLMKSIEPMVSPGVCHQQLESEMIQEAKLSQHQEKKDLNMGSFFIEDTVLFLRREWSKIVGRDYLALQYSTAWEENKYGK